MTTEVNDGDLNSTANEILGKIQKLEIFDESLFTTNNDNNTDLVHKLIATLVDSFGEYAHLKNENLGRTNIISENVFKGKVTLNKHSLLGTLQGSNISMTQEQKNLIKIISGGNTDRGDLTINLEAMFKFINALRAVYVFKENICIFLDVEPCPESYILNEIFHLSNALDKKILMYNVRYYDETDKELKSIEIHLSAIYSYVMYSLKKYEKLHSINEAEIYNITNDVNSLNEILFKIRDNIIESLKKVLNNNSDASFTLNYFKEQVVEKNNERLVTFLRLNDKGYQIHKPKKYHDHYRVIETVTRKLKTDHNKDFTIGRDLYIKMKNDQDKFNVYGTFTDIFYPDEENTVISSKVSIKDQIVEPIRKGQSVFVFGYGGSGAGKTSSLIYSSWDKKPGIIPNIVQNIINSNSEVNVVFKEFVIPNDENQTKNQTIKIQSEKLAEELEKTFTNQEHRCIFGTPLNPESSRSHKIVVISFSNDTYGKLIVGDFAGMENEFEVTIENLIKMANLKINNRYVYENERNSDIVELISNNIVSNIVKNMNSYLLEKQTETFTNSQSQHKYNKFSIDFDTIKTHKEFIKQKLNLELSDKDEFFEKFFGVACKKIQETSPRFLTRNIRENKEEEEKTKIVINILNNHGSQWVFSKREVDVIMNDFPFVTFDDLQLKVFGELSRTGTLSNHGNPVYDGGYLKKDRKRFIYLLNREQQLKHFNNVDSEKYTTVLSEINKNLKEGITLLNDTIRHNKETKDKMISNFKFFVTGTEKKCDISIPLNKIFPNKIKDTQNLSEYQRPRFFVPLFQDGVEIGERKYGKDNFIKNTELKTSKNEKYYFFEKNGEKFTTFIDKSYKNVVKLEEIRKFHDDIYFRFSRLNKMKEELNKRNIEGNFIRESLKKFREDTLQFFMLNDENQYYPNIADPCKTRSYNLFVPKDNFERLIAKKDTNISNVAYGDIFQFISGIDGLDFKKMKMCLFGVVDISSDRTEKYDKYIDIHDVKEKWRNYLDDVIYEGNEGNEGNGLKTLTVEEQKDEYAELYKLLISKKNGKKNNEHNENNENNENIDDFSVDTLKENINKVFDYVDNKNAELSQGTLDYMNDLNSFLMHSFVCKVERIPDKTDDKLKRMYTQRNETFKKKTRIEKQRTKTTKVPNDRTTKNDEDKK